MMSGARRIGSDETCLHCGAKGGVVPDGARYRCVMCGGPRIVVDPAVDRPRGEKPLLLQAKATRLRRAGWAMGAGLATALAAFAGVVTLIVGSIFDLGTAAWVGMSAFTVLPVLGAIFGWRRVSTLTSEGDEQLRAAEEHVAGELMAASTGQLRQSELARIMHVTEDRALELLAYGEVAGVLSGEGLPARRLRVEDQDNETIVHEAAERESKRARS